MGDNSAEFNKIKRRACGCFVFNYAIWLLITLRLIYNLKKWKIQGISLMKKKEAYRIMLLVIWGCRYSEENVWMASGDKVPRVFLFFKFLNAY